MSKRSIAIIVGAATLVFAALWFVSKIKPYQKPRMSQIDSLMLVKQIENKLWIIQRNYLINAIDSISKNTNVINNYYHTTYDSLKIDAPENCRPALELLYIVSEKRDSSRVAVIEEQEKIIEGDTKAISNYKDIVLLKDYTLKITRDTLADTRLELKDQKKKTNRAKTWGWVKTAGSAAVSIFLTSKLKP